MTTAKAAAAYARYATSAGTDELPELMAELERLIECRNPGRESSCAVYYTSSQRAPQQDCCRHQTHPTHR